MYVLANDYGCVACLGGIQGGCLRVMMVGNAKVNKRSGLVWSGLVWSGPVRSGPVWSGPVWSGVVWSDLV